MTQTNDPVDDQEVDQTPAAVDEEITQDVETKEVETNLDSEQVDYKAKFSDSAREAIKQSKENASLSSKVTLQEKMIAVAKDQSQIHEIAKHNPEIADKICQEYGWGDSYQAAISSTDEAPQGVVDPKQAAREVYQEQEQAKEQKAIENYEVQFFIDNRIAIGSPSYKAVMNTYSKYNPKTLGDSQELFAMAYNRHNPTKEVELPAPNGDFGSRGKVKSEFTDNDKKIMSENGWDAKKMREFKASELASW